MLKSSHKILTILLLTGVVLRLFLFLHFSDRPSFFLDDDSSGYLQLAENIRQGNGFSWEDQEPYTPNSFRTPGYPFFLLLHRLIGGSYRYAIITQILLAVATAFVIFLLAKDFGRSLLGCWAAAFFLFMPFSVMVSLRYLTQPLFTFGLVGAVWLWVRFLKTDSNRFLWLTALLLPALALLRPIAFYLYLPFLAGYLWYSFRFKKINLLRFFIVAAATVGLFFLVLSPWLIRNQVIFGHFALSSITPYQSYFYDAPAVYARNHRVSYAEARQFLEKDIAPHFQAGRFDDYMTFKAGEALSRRSGHYLTESWPGLIITRAILFVKFFVRDGAHYWAEFGLEGILLKAATWLERGVLLALGLGLILSLGRAIWYRDFVSGVSGFTLVLVVYFALLTGAVASAGLRFPVEPFIILLGLRGLASLKGLKILSPLRAK